MNRPSLRAALIPLGIALTLALMAVLFFHQLALTDHILGRGDPFTYFMPLWHARDEAFRAGSLPLWLPNLFMGVPLLANSQTGVFYPPNWLSPLANAAVSLKFSLIAHAIFAASGAYSLAWHTLKTSRLAALIAAACFTFSGMMGAQSEHINQFQGLAWLPWLFLLLHTAANAHTLIHALFMALLLGAALALQFFTGHTQTVWISIFGLALYALCLRRWSGIVVLAVAGMTMLPLVLPQLIPTLELSRLSLRSQGLSVNEALSFSLSPFAFGRGLLPNYEINAPVFPEYVAYIGVIGLGLAVIGALTRITGRWRWLIIAAFGLLLALGAYNPLYWLLANIPPFSLFRVPARWLALFVLAASMLAALGFDSLPVARRWKIITAALALIGIIASSALAVRAPDGDIPTASIHTVIAWLLALALFLVLALSAKRWRYARFILATALLIELFIASLVLPYNQLVTPDTAADPRLTVYQLNVLQAGEIAPGRVLSISELEWDPYDLHAITARYQAAGFSEIALHTALTAVKLQETLSHNLPAFWGISSIDGYDGGVLPTAWYSQWTASLTPDGQGVQDGRLREVLAIDPACNGACVPPLNLLNMMGVRYLILDKTHDLFIEDVAYDTGLPQTGAATYANPQQFEATEIRVLTHCLAETACAAPALSADSQPLDRLSSPTAEQPARFAFTAPHIPAEITVEAPENTVITAVTLVDTRTGDFQQLAPTPFTRILSSDIKLYINDQAARARLVNSQDGQPIEGEINFTTYTPDRVQLTVNTPEAATLILADAYYPGWTAAINGEPVEIARENTLFRAVPVPAGESQIVFTYAPNWLPAVFIIGMIAWLGLAVALLGLWGYHRLHPRKPA